MRRTKEFVEIKDYSSLDELIATLTILRDSLPADSEAELRLRGCDFFGRTLSVSYMRPLNEEETALYDRYSSKE